MYPIFETIIFEGSFVSSDHINGEGREIDVEVLRSMSNGDELCTQASINDNLGTLGSMVV